MPKEITVAEVVAALRSGDYEQGKEVLKSSFDNEHRFCCLGVAEELSGCFAPSDQEPTSLRFDWHDIYGTSYTSDKLAESLGEWGLFIKAMTSEHERQPGVVPAVMYHLAKMNDDGYTFNEIANEIEDLYARWDHGNINNFIRP